MLLAVILYGFRSLFLDWLISILFLLLVPFYLTTTLDVLSFLLPLFGLPHCSLSDCPPLLLWHCQLAFHHFAVQLVHPVTEQIVDGLRVFERNEAKAPWLQVSVYHYYAVLDFSIFLEERIHRVLRSASCKSSNEYFPNKCMLK